MVPPPYIGTPPYPTASSSYTGTPDIINITSSITIRLTSKNYMIWRAQVGPLLQSNLLMGYVDGSLPRLTPHVSTESSSSMAPHASPACQHLVQQDQAIMSAFVSSMTEGVIGMVMFAGTSREAWEILASAFAATSFACSSGL
jgi:hypothetical protein